MDFGLRSSSDVGRCVCLFDVQVLSNQQLLQRHKNDLSENEDRVNAIQQHLRNVRQELQLTQVRNYIPPQTFFINHHHLEQLT